MNNARGVSSTFHASENGHEMVRDRAMNSSLFSRGWQEPFHASENGHEMIRDYPMKAQ